jgi:hypothetical protein
MHIKRLIGSVAVAGIIGVSTLGIGEGVANASTSPAVSDTAVVQPVYWHGGHGFGPGFGRGFGHGYGHRYWGGWHGFRWWHPWGWHRW